MKLDTRYFGELEIDDNTIITFINGIPGFSELRRFVLLHDDAEGNANFSWLQCVDDTSIAFVLLDFFSIDPGYNPLVDDEQTQQLGDISENSLLILNIVNIPGDVKEMTVNLKAPVIINTKTLLGVQVIVNNEDYAVKHKVFGELSKTTGGV